MDNHRKYIVVTIEEIAAQLPKGSRTLQDVLNHMLYNGWELVQFLPAKKRSDDEAIFRVITPASGRKPTYSGADLPIGDGTSELNQDHD